MKRSALTAALFVIPTVGLSQLPSKNTSSWPAYRGPNGDGSTSEKIGKPWNAQGPKRLWKAETPNGFSSFSVADGIAATLISKNEDGVLTEFCAAWDASNGKPLWSAPMKMAKYDGGGDSGTRDNKGGDGPRSTPTIQGGKVYVLGSNLDLYCFDGKSGKPVWQKDLITDFDGKNIRWQNASSPIIDDDLCIVGGGGSGQAFLGLDKNTGDVKWKGESATITHATPTPAIIHGVRQLIFFVKSGLVSINPRDGKVLWRQSYKFSTSTAASPIVFQDIVYCSAGYGVGAGAFRIKKSGDSFTSEELWRQENKSVNHWSTPVCKDGYLYGMFQFKEYGEGPMRCVDIRTGEEKWSQPGFGPGNVILAAGQVVALSDKGELILIEPNPGGYKEIARADVLDGKCWSTPTIASGRIYARSTKEGACFEIPR